jgi:hypothetical protein
MISIGQSKTSLFYFLDLQQFESLTTPSVDTPTSAKYYFPIAFYSDIVRSLFTQISIQRFDLRPYCKVLSDYFIKIPLFETLQSIPTPFSHSEGNHPLADQLYRIAEGFFQFFHGKGRAIQDLLIKTVDFLEAVSRIFGFSSVTFAIDHFDKSEVQMMSARRDLTPTPTTQFLTHYLKRMIKGDSFVLSCSDSKQFSEMLTGDIQNEIDIRSEIELISIVGSNHSADNSVSFDLSITKIREFVP